MLALIGWAVAGGVFGGVLGMAICECSFSWGRKRRLIEAGRLCECGHGVWAHSGHEEGSACRHVYRTDVRSCPCGEFTARPAPSPRAQQLMPGEMFKRKMAELPPGGE